jgi:quercetin dioxygenase-like cupin family protein
VGNGGVCSGGRALGAGLAAMSLAGALAGCGASGGTPPSTGRTSAPTSAAASASPVSGVVRTQLAQGTMPDAVRIVVTTGPSQLTVQSVTIQPGAVVPWHIHPGWENTVVTAGQVVLVVAGDGGCSPRQVGAGQAFDVPARRPHSARNAGSVPARLIVTYLGTPPGASLATPVARPAGCPA